MASRMSSMANANAIATTPSNIQGRREANARRAAATRTTTAAVVAATDSVWTPNNVSPILGAPTPPGAVATAVVVGRLVVKAGAGARVGGTGRGGPGGDDLRA